VTDVRVIKDGRHVVKNEWPLKTVVIRPNADGDDQHGDELTQFQRSTSLSQRATGDECLLIVPLSLLENGPHPQQRFPMYAFSKSLHALHGLRTFTIQLPRPPTTRLRR
jgi:hypothetical protein